MNNYFSDLRAFVVSSDASLEKIFNEYAEEAKFGRRLFASDFSNLPAGSAILEIGGGSLILSSLLQREGFNVTALEPIGSGFSHFHQLQALVLQYAERHGHAPRLLRCTGESLSANCEYDYAFSINVMEHVTDVRKVLERALSAIKDGGTYRFMCPNYGFPYEPHFNIPTLLSRSLTKRFFWKKIVASKAVIDPLGTWESLNWITVNNVRKLSKNFLQVSPIFRKESFNLFLDRAFNDEGFRARRGAQIQLFLGVLQKLGLLRMTALIPASRLPIMDCSLIKHKTTFDR